MERTTPWRKSVYDRVEAKLFAIDTVWSSTGSLPSPFLSESQEDSFKQERQLGREVFSSILDKFPQIGPQYTAYRSLIDRRSRLSSGRYNTDHAGVSDSDPAIAEQVKTLSPQIQQLRDSNPDIRFLAMLDDGLFNIAHRRDDIRDVYSDLGADWQTPSAYDKELSADKDMFKGLIRAVVPGRFSIMLCIEPEAMVSYFKKQGYSKPEDINGFYSGSVLSFVSHTPEVAAHLSGAQPSSDVTSLFDHEDFHAYMNCFTIPKNDFPSLEKHWTPAIFDQAQKRLQDLASMARKGKARKRRNRHLKLKNALTELQDANHEELLADLVSREQHEVPHTTYFSNGKKKGVILSSINLADPETRAMVRGVKKRIAPESDISWIHNLHLYLGAANSDKLGEMRAALALFPVSQRRHIDGLVLKRWTNPSEPYYDFYKKGISGDYYMIFNQDGSITEARGD